MALRRVFVDSIANGVSRVQGAEAHHLHRVARLEVGENVEISDQQRVFSAIVKRTRPDLVEFGVQQELEAPGQGIRVVLLLSIIKFARFEWAIEKATELGVQAIVPLAAERSDRRLVEGAGRRGGRWRKIAFEAAQQSRRLASPEIEDPLEFREALAKYRAPMRLFCDTDSQPLSRVLTEHPWEAQAQAVALLFVGPEGGWSGEERKVGAEAGLTPVSLGPLILRTETAALAALTCLTTAADIRAPKRLT